MSARFGSPAELDAGVSATSPPQALLGGLTCRWTAETGRLDVVALPLDSVPAAVQDSFADTTCEGYYGDACRGAVASGGLWMQVRYLPATFPTEDLTPKIDAVLADVAMSAQAHLGAGRTPAAAGWWTLPTCESVSERVDMTTILGGVDTVPEYPADDILPDELYTVFADAGLERWCAWTAIGDDGNYGASVQLYVWPGAATHVGAIIDTGSFQPIAIDDADLAVLFEGARPSPDIVYATAGANAVRIYGWGETADLVEFAGLVLGQLEAIR